MKRLAIILIIAMTALSGHAFSLALDSVATWGKFPRFCVNVYRWGDKFFNGYDSDYVDGTGYKFNIKLRTESWTDYYNIRFDNRTEMSMISHPSTSLGLYLTYLAVSVGYDMNVSKYLGGSDLARKRWNFGFSCMLFSANLYFISNDVGSRISTMKVLGKQRMHPHLDFSGIDNTEWGLDLSYFFNHTHYSYPAAFSFSRIQKRSGGSFFTGFTYSRQDFKFDFNRLPEEYKLMLPLDWTDYQYDIDTHNYYLKFGYGHNWVVRRHWLLGLCVSPMIGITQGYIKYPSDTETTFGLLGKLQGSVVYNSGRWFAGAVLSGQGSLCRNKERSILSGFVTFEVSAGVRFNIW